MTNLKVGNIKKWQPVRNCDTREVDYGYLWIITKIENNITYTKSVKIKAKTRKEAIKIYRQKN